jgi:hypothetical protein
MLFGFPYGDSPITDEASEAISLPAIKRSSDNGNVGQVGFEITPKIRDKRVSIVEAAIPGEDKAPVGEIRLCLTAGLGGSVEGAIEERNGTFHVAELAVRALLLQELADILDFFRVDGPAVEIPNTCLHTHSDLPD